MGVRSEIPVLQRLVIPKNVYFCVVLRYAHLNMGKMIQPELSLSTLEVDEADARLDDFRA